jgi:hypothetical protein
MMAFPSDKVDQTWTAVNLVGLYSFEFAESLFWLIIFYSVLSDQDFQRKFHIQFAVHRRLLIAACCNKFNFCFPYVCPSKEGVGSWDKVPPTIISV